MRYPCHGRARLVMVYLICGSEYTGEMAADLRLFALQMQAAHLCAKRNVPHATSLICGQHPLHFHGGFLQIIVSCRGKVTVLEYYFSSSSQCSLNRLDASSSHCGCVAITHTTDECCFAGMPYDLHVTNQSAP